MNISKELIDSARVAVSVQVSRDDYSPKVLEVLRDYRRKAAMPGFRPGKVPEGVVRKMYGKAVLVDEINKLVSDGLQKYIEEQKFDLLGDPLPKMSGAEIDWEIGNDFTFEFELGLSPEVDLKLSKDDKLTKYQIILEQEVVDKSIENFTRRYGKYVEAEAVTDFTERITGDIVQLGNDGQPLTDGLSAEDSDLFMPLIKEDEKRKPFENAKIGDEIVFNLSETFPNDYEIASILKKEKEEIGDVSASLFKFTVKQMHKFANAELNQELFDNVLGKEAVTSSEEFVNKIREKLAEVHQDKSYSRFNYDMFNFLVEKTNLQLPEEFLRKRLLSTNEDFSEERLEAEFPSYLNSMKCNLIANELIKQYDLKITEQEVIEFTIENVKKQYNMYGIYNVPEEQINESVNAHLQDENNVRSTASQIYEKKITELVAEAVDLKIQEISLEDFNKLK